MRALAILLIAVALTGIQPRGSERTRVDAAEPLDPAHNTPVPCEALGTPGLLPRSAKNIVHVANVCGFVGTDVEFQSRTLADGSVRDYAFVGTMGAGLRIFDITDPAHPFLAGAYTDPGWQGDVQVRGDVAAIGFDPVSSTAPTTSECLQAKAASTGQRTSGGVDVVRLSFDAGTGLFATSLIGCVAGNPGGGAHTLTLHPSGTWLAMSNPRTHGSVDVVDLRSAPTLLYRIVQAASLGNAVCAGVRCIWNGRSGVWSPHDLSFSRDGDTMYVAAVGSDTVILDVGDVLAGTVRTISVVPNDWNGNGATDWDDITISHQSDTTADGAVLVVTDERGGGTSNTGCNTDPDGVIGGAHFWALAPVGGAPASLGASPATPKRLGEWVYPDPRLLVDPLQLHVRAERACTIHVLRLGGNGTAGPGPIANGYDGVSRLPVTQFTTAHYGAGVWWVDLSRASTPLDGIAEAPRSTWGNTLGWNVMPGAETWSAKEYKGFIYAGDMARGFDVYTFGTCEGAGCVLLPTSTPGSVSGGGKLEGEVLILRGTTAGGRAQFGLEVSYTAGALAPVGSLAFHDKTLGKRVNATSFDSLAVAGSTATMTGLATVNGVPGIRFFVEVEDLGGPGAGDLFRIVLADGYGALGRVEKGNVTVTAGP